MPIHVRLSENVALGTELTDVSCACLAGECYLCNLLVPQRNRLPVSVLGEGLPCRSLAFEEFQTLRALLDLAFLF